MSVGSSSSQIIPDLDCSLSPEPQFNPRLCQHQSGINNLNCIIVCTMKTHLFIDPLVIRPVSTSVTVDCVDPCTSRVPLTGGNRSGLTGYRSNQSGPVSVWAGTKPAQIQNLNLNSKKWKIPKKFLFSFHPELAPRETLFGIKTSGL